MTRLFFSVILICGIFIISACSIIGVNEITGYKLTVEVRDMNGQLIEDASVTSTADHSKKIKPGTYTLLYGSTGLYVVTITAPAMRTKQIKVSIPVDQDKMFSVVLIDK